MRFDVIAGVKFRKDGSQLMPHEVMNAKRRFLENASTIFGGATVQTGEGAYNSPVSGQLTVEPVLIFTIFGPYKKWELVRNLATTLRDDLTQESVLVNESEGNDHLI